MEKQGKFKNKRIDLTTLDAGGMIPPQAIELEEAVLGALILSPYNIDNNLADISPYIFYLDNHQIIAEALISMRKKGQPVDILTVTEKLREMGQLDIVGGPYMIAKLTSKVSSDANIEYHIKLIQQQALKRRIIQHCGIALSDAYKETTDVFQVHSSLQKNLDLSFKEVIKYQISSIGSIHHEIINESVEILSTGKTSGVPSGLQLLDNLTNGWQKSDMIILAGRPSMGKTAAGVSFLLHPVLKHKKPAAIFSLEMSKQQIVSRIQSSISGIDVSKIVKKQLDRGEISHIIMSCEKEGIDNLPLYIDDTPALSDVELKAKARKLVLEHGVELIVIDYLQLMRSEEKMNNREQEIANSSRTIKALAKELDIPIIALAQLNRAVEARADKKPTLADLRESGQIEQDADMVAFCYRPEYYKIDSYEIENDAIDSAGLFILIIAKHRNGAIGEIPLKFLQSQTKLDNHPKYYTHAPDEIIYPQDTKQGAPATKIGIDEKNKPDGPLPSMYELGMRSINNNSENTTDETLPF